MLAPIDAAWIFLKAEPTEREERELNERRTPSRYPPAPSYASTDRGYAGDPGEGEYDEGPVDTQNIQEAAPEAKPPIDQALESLRGGGAPWEEGPTLEELADMDPEEAEHHEREAGRRGAEPSDPPQRTLHDY